MKKRLLSFLTVLALTFALVPGEVFAAGPSWAPTSFAYTKPAVEVAILNAQSGKSGDVFTGIKLASTLKNEEKNADARAMDGYNGVHLYGHSYSDRAKENVTWLWDSTDKGAGKDFASTTLRKLMQISGNLKVNLAGTFYNRNHNHSHWKVLTKYTTNLTSYAGAIYYVADLQAAAAFGSQELYSTYPRIGDVGSLSVSAKDNYFSINAGNSTDGGYLQFKKNPLNYRDFEDRVCDCGQTYVENVVLTFMDVKAPKLTGIHYSLNDQSSFRSFSAGTTYVGEGETVYIRLDFDESLRLANPDLAKPYERFLLLRPSGAASEGEKAYFYKLEDKSLYFVYKNTQDGKEFDVAALDLTDFFSGSDMSLKQLGPKGYFSLNEEWEQDGSTNGISTTACIVTDLSGNPLGITGTRETEGSTTKTSYLISSPRLVVDSKDPEVKTVKFASDFCNSQLKAALNKTDVKDTDYTDNSDRYLGVGDRVTLKLEMSEELDLGQWHSYTNALVTTNLKRGEEPVKLRSEQWYIENDPRGRSYTVLQFVPLTITENMSLKGEKLAVTDLSFENGQPPQDFARNVTSTAIGDDTGDNPPLLDVAAPEVDDSNRGEVDYEDGSGFYYSFSLRDEGSGAVGVPGQFVLHNGGDQVSYSFRYLVSATAETPADNAGWVTGHAGETQSFLQLGESFLHIKVDPEEQYSDLTGCYLTVSPADFAGNTADGIRLPQEGTLEWSMDKAAPTITAGETGRKLKTTASDGGTLTAQVLLRDNNGVSGWSYAWVPGENGAEAPGEASWVEGEIAESDYNAANATAAVSATADVEDKTLFQSHLWAKATDGKGNESEAVYLGEYSYDLRAAQYTLKNSYAIQSQANASIHDLSNDDTLIFLVKVPENVSNRDNSYAVLAVSDYETELIANRGNIFQYQCETPMFSGWFYNKVTQATPQGGYTQYKFDAIIGRDDYSEFPVDMQHEKLRDTPVKTWWDSIVNGTYAGNLEVEVLSGKKSAVTRRSLQEELKSGGTAFPVATAGTAEQTMSWNKFTLRLSPENGSPYEFDADTGLKVTDEAMEKVVAHYPWVQIDAKPISTLENYGFTFTLSKDNYNYNYEDIDFASSYLSLKTSRSVPKEGEEGKVESVTLEYRVPLKPAVANSEGSLQETIIIPAATATSQSGETEYVSGGYTASVVIVGYSGGTWEYKFKNGQKLQVDNTKPNQNLGMTQLQARPDSEQAKTYGFSTELIDCIKGPNGVIYLPVNGVVNSEDSTTSNYANWPRSYPFVIEMDGNGITDLGSNFSGDNYNPSSHTTSVTNGRFTTLLWNTTPGMEGIVELESYDQSKESGHIINTETAKNFFCDIRISDKFSEEGQHQHKIATLYLKPNVDNVVAIQQLYANGRRGEIRYVTLHPVVQNFSGQARLSPADGATLVFTPDPAADLSIQGLTLYAVTTGTDNNFILREMTRNADNTWSCALTAGESKDGVYSIYATDTYGNRMLLGDSRAKAYFQGPEVSEADVSLNEAGKYSMSFTVEYDSVTQDAQTASPGLSELKVEVEEPYASALAVSSVDLLTLVGGTYGEWNADEKEPTAHGLRKVKLENLSLEGGQSERQRTKVKVTVEGYAPAGTEGATAVDANFALKLTATDAFGISDSAVAEKAYGGVTAAAYTEGKNAPSSHEDKGVWGVKLTFNQPVKPEPSWAWQESEEGEPYSSVWFAAFPISENGTTDIAYVDIFGNRHIQSITTELFRDSEGKDSGVKLDFSTLEPTGEAVTLTARVIEGKQVSLWKELEHGFQLIEKDDDPADHISTTTWDENTSFLVSSGGNGIGLRVYIANIVKGAPEADVRYYVYALGQEFTRQQLEETIMQKGGSFQVPGNVLVWYKTSRAVTATSGESQFIFTPENQSSGHTFGYEDQWGNAASVTVDLPEGLKLVSHEPPEDHEAPLVTVDLYAMRSNVYTKEESFTPGDVIAQVGETGKTVLQEKLAAMGYVQGYRLVLSASDPSGVTLSMTAGEGVSRGGNVITVEKAADLTVTVQDNSPHKNEVSFTLPATLFEPYLDRTAPTLEIIPKAVNVYQQTLYVRLADQNDKGDSASAWLTLPTELSQETSGEFVGCYKLPVTTNGTFTFRAVDGAGNTAMSSYTVSTLDNEPPIPTETWTPPFVKPPYAEPGYEEPAMVYHDRLSTDPVNSNVMAFVDFDKALSTLTLDLDESNRVELIKDNAVTDKNPYTFTVSTGENTETYYRVSATPERVTVTYFRNTGELCFTATAPNQQSSRFSLQGVTIIDKDPPKVVETRTELKRKRENTTYEKPYAVEVTLTPNENVTSPNYGGTIKSENNGETVYLPEDYYPGDNGDEGHPLKLTFRKNGTYNVRFVDMVGNVTVKTITINDLDNTAPIMEISEPTGEWGQSVSVNVTVNEPCTVTYGKNGVTNFTAADFEAGNTTAVKTVTFTENGTFTLTATDLAGNHTTKLVKIATVDNLAPTIHFSKNTVYLLQNSTEEERKNKLDTDFTLSDNMTSPSEIALAISYDVVDLSTAGLYSVPYVLTDKAQNKTEAVRFVQVIGEDTLCVRLDGQLIMPEETAPVKKGRQYTLTLTNCDEPYSIKARKGILSTGQMKYLNATSLTFAPDGTFTPTATGFYTLLVTTQSRRTIRILLYVEL